MNVNWIAKHYPDNFMMTSFNLHTREDVEQALEGSGFDLDSSCRVRYQDNGLLATFRASSYDKEIEPWFAIAWGTLRDDERETWLYYWQALAEGKVSI